MWSKQIKSGECLLETEIGSKYLGQHSKGTQEAPPLLQRFEGHHDNEYMLIQNKSKSRNNLPPQPCTLALGLMFTYVLIWSS